MRAVSTAPRLTYDRMRPSELPEEPWMPLALGFRPGAASCQGVDHDWARMIFSR
jgi:hypothetical protein